MDDLKQIRRIVSIAVYGLVSIVIALIIVRILLLVIGASQSAAVVSFIYSASDTFVGMFRGIYPNIVVNGGQFIIEIYSVVALLFYVSVAYLISKSIRSVIEADIIQIITNLIDTGFEFVLVLRFIFKLTGASLASQFVTVLYQISNVIYEPFKGILPGFSIPSINVIFETSTLIAIIIIIVFDVVSEGIINHLRKEWEQEKTDKASRPSKPSPQVITRVEKQVVQVPTQVPAQHITINLPQQPQQSPNQYIDKRTVQVVSPNMPLQPANHPNYPYFGANDLEHQRPEQNNQLQGQGYYPQPQNEPSASRNANHSSANS